MHGQRRSGVRAVIERLAIVGVGLIGGSLARGLRRAGAVGEVVGAGRGRPNLERALELGVIDRIADSPAAAAAGADVILIAAPLGATTPIFAALADAVGPEAVVTDAGSTKRSVVEAARATLGPAIARFVPGHPIAGTEQSGVDAAFAELYRDHRVILTPLPETEPGALSVVRTMWETVGARVEEMDFDRHDALLAATSHLPHLLAYALVDLLATGGDADEVFAFAAGGFRDFTRIASSNPEMWRDIALANREALLGVCDRYTTRLGELRNAVAAGDGERLAAAFTRAKEARDRCVVPEANVRGDDDA